MKLNRQTLISHLAKIACGGQIDEVVFSGAFSTAALTHDRLLCVIAPDLPGVEPLEEPIGVGRLSFFQRAIGYLSGTGNESTEIQATVEEFRLRLNEEHRGKQFLLTANISTIGTVVSPTTLEKLEAAAPSGKGIPLTRSLVNGIQNCFAGYKAEELELQVGKKGGKVVVGSSNSDYAEFEDDLSALKTKKGEKPYTLLFGKHLIDVLGVITNFTEAAIHLGGPDSFIMITEGKYKWILSPRSRGSDAQGGDGEEADDE